MATSGQAAKKNEEAPVRVLIVDKMWGSQLLEGSKTWEMRRTACKIRGRVLIAYAGTGMIYGSVDVVDSKPLTREDWLMNVDKHKIPPDQLDEYGKYLNAWVVEEPKKLAEPIPYEHPQGAVIWVRLDSRYENYL